MSESKLQTKIIKYLESLGWYVRKIITCNKNGTPDIIACDTSGKFWAFEVKFGRNGCVVVDARGRLICSAA